MHRSQRLVNAYTSSEWFPLQVPVVARGGLVPFDRLIPFGRGQG